MKCAKEKQVVSFADNKFYSVLVEGLCVALLGKCNTIALFETLFGFRGFDTTIFQRFIFYKTMHSFIFPCSQLIKLRYTYIAKWKKADFMAKITLKLFCF